MQKIPFTHIHMCIRGSRHVDRTGGGLLRCCRQLYSECIGIAYENLIFAFTSYTAPCINLASPFLHSLGNRALSNLRHLSLELEEPRCSFSHREYPLDPEIRLENWLIQGSLKSLFLTCDVDILMEGEEDTLFSWDSWMWACSVIEKNQKIKMINTFFLDIVFEVGMPSAFINRVTSNISAWHGIPPIAQDEAFSVTDASGHELVLKQVRTASCGSKTVITLRRQRLEDDDDNDDDDDDSDDMSEVESNGSLD